VRLVAPEGRRAHILVAEDQLSLAIGKEGQNVRLAARLTGWKIDIKDIAKYDRAAEDTKLAAEATRLEELAGDYDADEAGDYDEETAEFEEEEAVATEETEAAV
jgi:N utilization substance protein A